MTATNRSKLALVGIEGKKFGKLTVIEFTGVSTVGKQRRRIVKCICDCGKEKLVPLTYLKRDFNQGKIPTCGCRLIESAKTNIKLAHAKLAANGTWEKDPRIASGKKVWQSIYRDEDLSFDQFMVLSQQDCFYCGSSPSNVYRAYCERSSQFRRDNGDFTA